MSLDISFLQEPTRFKDISKIRKGSSHDKKYILTDSNYQRYLLRLSNESTYETKQKEFAYLQKLKDLQLPLSIPKEIGKTEQFVYLLFLYIEGEDLEDVIDSYSLQLQYQLGLQAGMILQKLHQLPCSEIIDYKANFIASFKQKKERYQTAQWKNEQTDECIRYVENHLDTLKNGSLRLIHGDFQIGNMILSSKKDLHIIDFNQMHLADPVEEFAVMALSYIKSTSFAKGILDGYFNQRIPENFYSKMAFYMAFSIIDGPENFKTLTLWEQCLQAIIKMFDHFTKIIPDFME